MTGAGGRLEPALLKCVTSAHPGVSARSRASSSSVKPTVTRSLYGERRRGQLGVARASWRQLAAHERHALDAQAPEVGGTSERLAERRLPSGLAHAAERDVPGERSRLTRHAEIRAATLDALGHRRERA